MCTIPEPHPSRPYRTSRGATPQEAEDEQEESLRPQTPNNEYDAELDAHRDDQGEPEKPCHKGQTGADEHHPRDHQSNPR